MNREPYNLFLTPQGANNNSDVVGVLNKIQADIKKKKNNNTIKIPINQIKNITNIKASDRNDKDIISNIV